MAVRTGDCSHISNSGNHIGKPAYTRQPIPPLENLPILDSPSHQGKPKLKHPEQIPHPKLSNREGQHPLLYSPAYQPLKGSKTQRKPLSKVSAPGLEIRGKSSELSLN
jgi:hypothetical protein